MQRDKSTEIIYLKRKVSMIKTTTTKEIISALKDEIYWNDEEIDGDIDSLSVIADLNKPIESIIQIMGLIKII